MLTGASTKTSTKPTWITGTVSDYSFCVTGRLGSGISYGELATIETAWDGSQNADFGIQRNSSSTTAVFIVARASGSAAITSVTVGTGIFRIAVSRTSGTLKYCVDGGAVTTAASAGDSIPNDSGLYTVLSNDAAMELAEFAFWNRTLSDAELISVTKGFSPRRLLRGLVQYHPLIRDTNDLCGSAGAATVVSGTQSWIAHPRVY